MTIKHWRRKRGGAGGCSPPERWTQGAAPPYTFASMVPETRCEIKLPAAIHSGMAQKRIESFFAPGSAANSNCSTGKLALPGSWRMPRFHDTWRRGLCRRVTCTAALRVWHFSAFHYQMNCIIIITMFVPFTLLCR